MPSTIIKMPNASSVQRRQQQNKNKNGIKIGCFRVCTCIHLDFLTSKSGMLKLFELLLGSCCETLLINFGMQASAEIGKAFHGFLTTVTACLTTTFVLCLCYVLSSRSYNLIRQSLFEFLFNGLSCLLYASASSYMGVITNLWLYPRFKLFPSYNAYPAMTCVYYVGTISAIVYGADTIVAYKHYRDACD
ncbi:unnamed protein product [Diamesa hyperborea]